MHWDRLFEDLEGQLAAEWEGERAALDAESERLRIARVELRSRLRRLCAASAEVTIELPGVRERVRLQTLGADWIAATALPTDAVRRPTVTRIIPLHALRAASIDHGLLLASLDGEESASMTNLRERMTFGFVLRDLARRRVPLTIDRLDGPSLHGTVDRAGADHLDLAVHDPGEVRRPSAVQSFCIVPFASMTAVRMMGSQIP